MTSHATHAHDRPHLSPGTRRAAQAVPLLVLPSALWRIALLLGLPVAGGLTPHGWEYPYILGLSLVTEGLALLTLGLVRPWGETFPRWVPWLAGRRVPITAAAVPAALGATALTLIWGSAFRNVLTTPFVDNFGGAYEAALVVVCYAPLLLWGPTLAYVTVAYVRRRVASGS